MLGGEGLGCDTEGEVSVLRWECGTEGRGRGVALWEDGGMKFIVLLCVYVFALKMRWAFLSSQQLLNSSHPSVTNQIQLEQQKTVKTCADTVQNLPTLPLPFVRPQLTRVIFATSVSQESLKQPLTHDGVLTGRHRAASGSGSKDSNILAEEGEIVKHSSTGVSITQHLRSLQHSGDSVIGTSDYDPSRLKVPKEQWVSLEKRAASGLRGVAMENFKPSLLVMDHTTDNSNTPFCVINGQ